VTSADLLAVALGFVLGFLIGMTGVGGGALVAPALYVILGLNYGDSVAVSLIYSFLTKIVGAIQHVRQGTVLWRISLAYGVTGIPGAIVGAQVVYWAGPRGEQVFPFVMSTLLVVVALLILMEVAIGGLAAREKPFSPDAIGGKELAIIAVFQLFVGILLGVTSVGSGSLIILSMLFLFRMTAKEIVGSNIVIALLMVLPAGVAHYVKGGVSWWLVAMLLLGSLVGTVLGAKTTLIVPDRVLKLTIAVLIMAGALATVVKAAW